MASGIVITNVHDAFAAAAGILESARYEVAWLIPSSLFSLSLSYGFREQTKAFIERGGVSWGVVSTSQANAAELQANIAIGEDIRRSNAAFELFMFVADRRDSISAVNVGMDYTLKTPVTAFWSEDPTYAEYLLTSFEAAWAEAEPAARPTDALVAQR